MSADKKKAPELLSPAGNPEKLRYAVDYGADAVYCARAPWASLRNMPAFWAGYARMPI